MLGKMVGRNKQLMLLAVMIMALTLVTAIFVHAEPAGPDLTNFTSSSRTATFPAAASIQAGNVSEINMNGFSTTQSWAAFFGTVTGTITLDDSVGNSIYDWSATSPGGEVYATTYSGLVDWTAGNVVCWNWSFEASANWTTPLQYEQILGINSTDSGALANDPDRMINSTFFANRSHSQFYVGSFLVNGTNHDDLFAVGSGRGPTYTVMDHDAACPSTFLYNSTGEITELGGAADLSGTWEEVLMMNYNLSSTAPTSDQIIYVSLLENDGAAFNGSTADFQMIVGEKGTLGDTSLTTYYFYVELA